MSNTLIANKNHQTSSQVSSGPTTYAVYLRLNQISRDGSTQSRVKINYSVVEEYAEALQERVTFPPITVYYDGEFHWLADGFHRVLAAQAAGIERIAADIRQGTRREAVLHSVGANACHGLRRTNADKHRAVETLLRDEEWGKWSDNAIAKACGVSQPFVGKIRAKLSLSYNGYKIERTVQRDGSIYTQNTAKIGSKSEGIIEGSVAASNRQTQETQQLESNAITPLKERDADDSSVNTAVSAHGKPDVVAVEIAIGARHLTPEQLAWSITSAASNGLSDSHLKAVIKAAKQALNQRHHPEYFEDKN